MSEEKRCYICGVKLIWVNEGWFCPNHGPIGEQEESTEETPSYFN